MSDFVASWTSDERKVRLLEWLVTLPRERTPATKRDLAEELGVSPRTLRDWQADESFIKEWRAEAARVAGPPERTQQVLQALFDAATDPDAKDRVPAAKLWLEGTNNITPRNATNVERDKPTPGRTAAAELSDDELYAMLAERMAKSSG